MEDFHVREQLAYFRLIKTSQTNPQRERANIYEKIS